MHQSSHPWTFPESWTSDPTTTRASLPAPFQYPGTTSLQVERHRLPSSDMGDEVLRCPWWTSGKESACNAGDPGLIPGSGRSPGEGHGNPLQHSCLENPTDRGAWRATVYRVTKSWSWWRDWARKHTRRPQEELGWSKFWKQLGVTVSGLEDRLLQMVLSENKAGQTGGMSCSWTTLRKQRQKFGSEPHSSSWLLGEGQNGTLNSI